ncbi:MAG: tyrosine-type recombinase/integrase [Chthoniobacterales bacterium]
MSEKAITVKSGSASVKIYIGRSRGNALYTVAHYHGGRRVRKVFADLKKARDDARMKAQLLQTGEMQALTLTDKDKAAYVAALESLRPTGKRLEIAAAEYADAVKALNGRDKLGEAISFYLRHHPRDVSKKLVTDLISEMIDAKQADGASGLYLKDLRSRLAQFASRFNGFIGNITSSEIDDWLRGLLVGARTRNNLRNSVVTLFRFAKSRGYLPKDRLTEADGLAKAKERRNEIGILTPEQMTQLLAAADFDLVPFFAIGAFAGLRHWEMLRLIWADINFDEGHILVAAEKAKTAQRRIVPIQPNLAAWLMPYRKNQGRICPSDNMSNVLRDLTKEAEFKWPKNGLRHSYGSYRLAQTKNAAQVSLEMGNSPRMVFQHYREVVTEKRAQEWFGVLPKRVRNIVSIAEHVA